MANYSPFWGNDSYALLINKNPRRGVIRQLVNRSSFRVTTELFDSLIGAASGGAASATHKQVAHGKESGIKEIETVTDISRNTTAADVTALKEMVFNVSRRPAYPVDASGNGGPAFA